MNIAGVKSWSTFIKSAKYCSIEQDNEGFRFIPHKNMGKNGGYEVIQQNVFTLKTPFDEILDLAKIGDSLNKVFEFCE
ncbi:hypothetical protein H206_02228 [Candidatus Electrothrix aarhusensis]|uniref:Uncharacterized protein n=1 Tax=Candidatus Electrothrix aarhusensis TaxID=1859131 RepID=A0A3S3U7Y1_9BACT|nr:hypothetical protein H206_02228 [Candidatus Electrothrix aarhusensis]